MSNSLASFTITLRKNTETQSVYCGSTERGNLTLVGTITAASGIASLARDPQTGRRVMLDNSLEYLYLAGTIASNDKVLMQKVAMAIEAQFEKQLANSDTNPTVDLHILIEAKSVPMAAIGINPVDGQESASIIFSNNWEYAGISAGTSITLDESAQSQILASAQDINTTRSVRSYHDSMSRSEARRASVSNSVAAPARTQVAVDIV